MKASSSWPFWRKRWNLNVYDAWLSPYKSVFAFATLAQYNFLFDHTIFIARRWIAMDLFFSLDVRWLIFLLWHGDRKPICRHFISLVIVIQLVRFLCVIMRYVCGLLYKNRKWCEESGSGSMARSFTKYLEMSGDERNCRSGRSSIWMLTIHLTLRLTKSKWVLSWKIQSETICYCHETAGDAVKLWCHTQCDLNKYLVYCRRL